MKSYVEGFSNIAILALWPPRVVAAHVVPHVHDRLAHGMRARQLHVDVESATREQVWTRHICNCERVVNWWARDKSEDVLVRLREEA